MAGRLFSEAGISETQMSHIANAAGLRQSSLYYYYRRKDDILRALMARANVVPIAAAKEIVREGGSAPLQLYRFVRADAIGLCSLPFDANEIHRLAARDPDGFADYWHERELLERLIAKVIRKGVKDDDFRQVDPRLFARITLSNSEGAQNWFRSDTRWDAETVGETLADGMLRAIMVDPSRLADVRDEASRRRLSDSTPEID